jgi:hypothetical protein
VRIRPVEPSRMPQQRSPRTPSRSTTAPVRASPCSDFTG